MSYPCLFKSFPSSRTTSLLHWLTSEYNHVTTHIVPWCAHNFIQCQRLDPWLTAIVLYVYCQSELIMLTISLSSLLTLLVSSYDNYVWSCFNMDTALRSLRSPCSSICPQLWLTVPLGYTTIHLCSERLTNRDCPILSAVSLPPSTFVPYEFWHSYLLTGLWESPRYRLACVWSKRISTAPCRSFHWETGLIHPSNTKPIAFLWSSCHWWPSKLCIPITAPFHDFAAVGLIV